MKKAVRIGITLGDVNGIGPEIALKAVHQRGWPRDVHFVLIGSPSVVARQARRLHLSTPPVCPLDLPTSTLPAISIWDPAPRLTPPLKPGRVTAAASRAAEAWIHAAVAACLNRKLHGMVTAPICKEGLQAAGIRAPGHTEMLARLCGTQRFAMMLFGPGLRVILATRHVPLAKVAATLNTAALLETIELTGEALPWLGCRGARIGVCGLNPHAGDGGALGSEEKRVITPAIVAARRKGFHVAGPIPADVIFHQAINGQHDAVVAMYHDQGLGPLKMLAFECGVNITLGLPIVRTSPDHGTAFDIAGRGIANPSSMVEAVRWAVKLAQRKNPWRAC